MGVRPTLHVAEVVRWRLVIQFPSPLQAESLSGKWLQIGADEEFLPRIARMTRNGRAMIR